MSIVPEMEDNMKFKRVVSIFVLFAVCMTLVSSQVFAQSDSENPFGFFQHKEHEQQVLDAIMNDTELPPDVDCSFPEIAPLVLCTSCAFMSVSVCSADGRIDGSGTHKYGILLNKTCTRTVLFSRAGYVCTSCYHVDPIDGEHWCWDVHKDCGKGQVDMCPMEIS